MQTTQKFLWANNIRFFATLGVIILHVSSTGLYLFGKVSLFYWGIANTFDSVMRCCVPLFVMLSGALLLRQDKELIPYLKNRFIRVVVPFLFWAVIYSLAFIAIQLIRGQLVILQINPITLLTDIIYYDGLFKQHAYHLWYIYMILGLFLVVPILRKWIKNASEKEIIYFLILWGITILLNTESLNRFMPNIDLTFFSGYLGYFVLGYYLSIKSFEEKPLIKKTLGFSIFCLVAVTALGTYFLTARKGSLDQEFYGYLSPNVILLSVAVFLYFKTLQIQQPRLNKWIEIVNQYSFGIYLVHVAILYGLENIGVDWVFIHPFIGIPLTTSICLLFSVAIIYLLHKIPGGKHISG